MISKDFLHLSSDLKLEYLNGWKECAIWLDKCIPFWRITFHSFFVVVIEYVSTENISCHIQKYVLRNNQVYRDIWPLLGLIHKSHDLCIHTHSFFCDITNHEYRMATSVQYYGGFFICFTSPFIINNCRPFQNDFIYLDN